MIAEPEEDRPMSPGRAAWCGLTLAVVFAAESPAQTGYQKPPRAVLDVLNAPAPPQVSVSPTGEHVLFVQTDRYPSIAHLAEPTLRLAGTRINPRTNGPDRAARVAGLKVQNLDTGAQFVFDAPPGSRFGLPVWAPDGKRFA